MSILDFDTFALPGVLKRWHTPVAFPILLPISLLQSLSYYVSKLPGSVLLKLSCVADRQPRAPKLRGPLVKILF